MTPLDLEVSCWVHTSINWFTIKLLRLFQDIENIFSQRNSNGCVRLSNFNPKKITESSQKQFCYDLAQKRDLARDSNRRG